MERHALTILSEYSFGGGLLRGVGSAVEMDACLELAPAWSWSSGTHSVSMSSTGLAGLPGLAGLSGLPVHGGSGDSMAIYGGERGVIISKKHNYETNLFLL